MSNKASISNEQCLTEEQLLRYAEGAMTRDEERAVDRHIASCDMCSDAVEGALLISTTDFKKHSASIGDKIDKTFDKGFDKNLVKNAQNTEGPPPKENTVTTLKPVRSLRLLRWVAVAAASVLVLATAGVWLLTTDAPPNQEAKTAATETTIEATPQTNNVLLDTVTSSSASGILSDANVSESVTTVPQSTPQMPIKSLPAKPTPSSEGTFADIETEVKKDKNTTTPVILSAPRPAAQPIDNQPVMSETSNDGMADFSKAKDEEPSYPQANEAAKLKKKTEDRMASSNASNAQSKMKPSAAPVQSSKIALSDEQLFQTGVNYFNQQDYGNALSNFSKVKPEKVNSDVYEQVQWLSALSQLKQGKKMIAKSILESIVAGKGKYAAQAAEVLKTSF
jgi:hypothetical protein